MCWRVLMHLVEAAWGRSSGKASLHCLGQDYALGFIGSCLSGSVFPIPRFSSDYSIFVV